MQSVQGGGPKPLAWAIVSVILAAEVRIEDSLPACHCLTTRKIARPHIPNDVCAEQVILGDAPLPRVVIKSTGLGP
eukprot:scaffold34822_cov32-Tisochrysis_lutea.AAC.5